MRLRLMVEVEANEVMRLAVVQAIETGEQAFIRIPQFVPSTHGQIVGAVPVEPVTA